MMVVQSVQPMQYLPSVQPTTSSATQQMDALVMVVQSALHFFVMLYLFSMEPTTSLATQQTVVVISADFNTSLAFIGTTGFSNNSANHNGGAIYAETESLLKFTGISDYITNIAYNGGAISTGDYVSLEPLIFHQQLCNER